MKLSKRLLAIYDMVPSSVVADVGADHGKLIIALALNGIASHGYAIENKKGPFERLKKAVEDVDLGDKIDVLLSDGIEDIPSVVNTVIIAGMGGHLIIDILKKNSLKLAHVTTIIVDAHNAIPELREEVTRLGYMISDEEMVEECGKFYEIIKFSKADIAFLSELDKEFGPVLRKEKSILFKEKQEARIKSIDGLIETNDIDEPRINKLKEEKRRIKSIL